MLSYNQFIRAISLEEGTETPEPPPEGGNHEGGGQPEEHTTPETPHNEGEEKGFFSKIGDTAKKAGTWAKEHPVRTGLGGAGVVAAAGTGLYLLHHSNHSSNEMLSFEGFCEEMDSL